MKPYLFLSAVLVVSISCIAPATGTLVVSVRGPNSESEMSIRPGDPLNLIISVDGPEGYTFGSFRIDVSISGGAMPITAYAFVATDTAGNAAFLAGGAFDFSDPATLHFEAAVNTIGGPRAVPGDLIETSLDTSGTATGEQYVIGVVLDTFDCGVFSPCPDAGPPFMRHIVPEPGTIVLLGVGGLVAARRRRSGASASPCC